MCSYLLLSMRNYDLSIYLFLMVDRIGINWLL